MHLSKFKKILTCVLTYLFITSFFFIPNQVKASTETGEDNISVLDLTDNSSSIDKVFNNEKKLSSLIENDFVIIEASELSTIDRSNIQQIIDNGTVFAVSGENLDSNYLRYYLEPEAKIEDESARELLKDTGSDTTKGLNTKVLYVSNIESKNIYGSVIDCEDLVLTNDKGEKKTAKDIAISRNEYEEFTESDYFEEIVKDNQEVIGEIIQDNSTKDSVSVQMPPSNWTNTYFNNYYSLAGCAEMKGLVYSYFLGNYTENGKKTAYFDFISSMGATASKNASVTSYSIKLDVNASGQTLVDYSWLDSNSSQLSLSLASDKTKSVSWTSSSTKQRIGNVPSYSGNYVQWNSTINYPYTKNVGYKIEPGIRAKNTIAPLMIKRSYSMSIIDGAGHGWSTGTITNTGYASH